MNKIKRFFKELKRVKWPTGKEGWKTFFTSSGFIITSALILFAIGIAFTALWAAEGIGL